MFGKLYIVATPIGNIKDVTLRAIDILYDVDIIIAEDTRVTKKLLDLVNTNHQEPSTIISFHAHSSEKKMYEILNHLVKGKNIALVTDAGTPGISDPGNELIEFILSKEPKIEIVPIPGPSALTALLSISGKNVQNFVFLAFLPRKKRTKLFTQLKQFGKPFIFYESPNRIVKSLEAINEYFDKDTEVVVGRELTKMHETIYRGSIVSVIEKLKNDTLKGELTVLVEI